MQDESIEKIDRSDVDQNDKSYHVVLSNYDGPIDLLLDLVRRKKILIEEIFISDITEQYLQAMEQIDEIDMDQAADFIEVAATLLLIKSSKLLPRAEEPESPVEEAKADLINRIEEYKLYKEAAEKMRRQEVINMHYRAPDDSVGQPRLVLKDMTTDGLMNALKKVFEKFGVRSTEIKTKKIKLDPFTVAEKSEFIREIIKTVGKVTFYELFEEDYTINEVVTTFMALLELLKGQEVRVEQNDIFDTITIYKRSDGVSDGN